MAEEIYVNAPGKAVDPVPGSAGLNTQLPGQATTVDGVGGGVGEGLDHLSQVAIDEGIVRFKGNITPLMTLMMKSKKVTVDSSEVAHYMIDEARTKVAVSEQVEENTGKQQFPLPMTAADAALCLPCKTLLCRGVNGYLPDGKTETPGLPLLLYIIGRNDDTGYPIVRALNGKRQNPTDDYCQVPQIPAGTVVDILSTAMHETQREVSPSACQPVARTLYLQKRGLNLIWSDYYDSQKKIIDFSRSTIAEAALDEWKREGNRTLWISRMAKFTVQDPKTGQHAVRTTEGVRWQFMRELVHTKGVWTYREFIALAKMFYCGADKPEGAICLCGKNFLENIQCIDFSSHPEIQIGIKHNSLGWDVHNIHTAFGDFEFIYEPTLDDIGYSNSCGIFGLNRLVHYQRVSEHKESERVEGHEANRESVIVWDAMGLKGACHIFVNGEGTPAAANAVDYVYWDSETAPESDALVKDRVYIILKNCKLATNNAIAGEYWQYDGENWKKLQFENLGEKAA